MGFQRVGRKLVTEQKQLIRKGKVRQHERSWLIKQGYWRGNKSDQGDTNLRKIAGTVFGI